MDAKEKEHLLSRVDLFESCSPVELSWLSQRVPLISLSQNQTLYGPRHVGQTLYLLLRGRMHLYKAAGVGGGQQTFEVLTSGMFFGGHALSGRPSDAYAQALEPSSVALMSIRTFRELAKGNVEVSLKMAELLSQRVHLYESRMADIALKEVPARLATLLLHLCEREGVVTSEGHYRIATRYTHEQLSEMIGAKRVTVTRAFGALKKAQAMEVRQRTVYIKDLKALRALAEEEFAL
jgi:CRP-like cAMP-binding protein